MKDLNLIPKSYILAKKKKQKRMYNTLVIAGVAAVLIFMIALPLGMKYRLILQKNALDMQIKETSNYLAVEKQINTVKNLYKLREDEGNKLRNYGIDVKVALEGIEKALPEKLFVTGIGINSKDSESQVIINGVGASEDEIATFVSYLRTNSSFETVVLTSVSKLTAKDSLGPVIGEKGNNAGYGFNIAIYLKSGK